MVLRGGRPLRSGTQWEVIRSWEHHPQKGLALFSSFQECRLLYDDSVLPVPPPLQALLATVIHTLLPCNAICRVMAGHDLLAIYELLSLDFLVSRTVSQNKSLLCRLPRFGYFVIAIQNILRQVYSLILLFTKLFSIFHSKIIHWVVLGCYGFRNKKYRRRQHLKMTLLLPFGQKLEES